MRYLFIAACAFIISESAAQAQIPVRFGLALGVNFAGQSYARDIYSPLTHRSGFLAGALVEVGISDLLYVQAEPRYIQKGTKLYPFAMTMIPSPGPEGVETLDYLEVPLHLKTKFGTSDIKPFAFAGPTVGLLLSASEDVQDFNIHDDSKDNYNSLDYSFDLGGGVEYRVSTSVSLFGNACYSFGLRNISNQLDITIHSRGIQIVFGSLFTL